ncbi:MAG: phosphoribosylformylglycinamidine synthase subunit PurQ [Methanobacteriaceae archaeon]|nr:phosphoribosylformylglycinamidine synthase subunit PurQ [Methanobacteriaceae archaeon]
MTNIADVKVGIIRFPGSNCDRDVYKALELVDAKPEYIYWNNKDLSDMDAIVIPGGFSYGDYLRAGAIAAITPIIDSLKTFAKEGNPILGICNGAQILGEVNLVPGVFIENKNVKFICDTSKLEIKTTRTPFTKLYKKNQKINLPIAHAEGRYYTDDIQKLYDNDQIVLTFADNNPNGSLENITGVCNIEGNVCAMMPHPERAVEELLQSTDGLNFFKGLI